jgi:hypothetical protein
MIGHSTAAELAEQEQIWLARKLLLEGRTQRAEKRGLQAS